MTALEAWITEIESLASRLNVGPSLALDRPAGRALARATCHGGFPGVIPLWSARRYTVGLLADPLAVPRSWPGVILQDGEGLTVATDSRTLLPQLLIRHISRFPARATRLAEAWGEIGQRMHALHNLLGGEEQTIEDVVGAATDPDLLRALAQRNSDERRFQTVCSALCRRVDDSEPFRHLADWLDAAIARMPPLPRELAAYGPWSRRVLCWSYILGFAGTASLRPPTAWLYRIIEADAGVDSGLPVRASWQIDPGGASAETALLEAAMLIEQGPAAQDRVTAAMARAMCMEGTAYRGLAHAEAVVVLDEQREPSRAWGALQSAAWWAAHNMGEVPDVILRGARFLAERHDWVDILTVLDRASGR